jgi:hypothetical protein
MRAVVPAPKLSTVVMTKPPTADALVGGITVNEVTAKARPKPEAAFVVNIGASRKTADSERMSAPVMVTVLLPLLMVAIPANASTERERWLHSPKKKPRSEVRNTGLSTSGDLLPHAGVLKP